MLITAYSVAATIIREYTGERIPIERTQLNIEPPEYTYSLIEVVERLMDKPKTAREIPRFLDFIFYEYLLNGKEIVQEEIRNFFFEDLDLLSKLSKNVISFAVDKEISEQMFKPLLDF